MSAHEEIEWAAFELLEGPLPVGPRQDILAGIVASTIANANRGKRGRPLKPVDFIPEWQRAAERLAPPSPVELRDKAFAIFGAMQGRGK